MIVPLEFLKSPFLNRRNWNANCSQQKGRALPCTFSNFVCSPMGAIPKKHSHPPLPNGISLTIFCGPLARVLTTQSPISYLKSLGPNALMIKLDLSNAFRHILLTLVIDVMSDGSTRTGYFFDMFLAFSLWSMPAALFLKFVNSFPYRIALRDLDPLWNHLDDFWA